MSLRSSSNSSLLPGFWGGVVVLAAYVLANAGRTPLTVLLTGFLLAAFALLPGYLWCAAKIRGLPIFPLMALTYVWAYALPLLNQQSQVARYDASAQVQAGLTAVLFLLPATLIWWLLVRIPPSPPKVVFALREDMANSLFLTGLALCCVIQMALQATQPSLPRGVGSILNAANGALSTLSVIILSNRWGRRRLARNERILFLVLLVSFLLINAVSLLLVAPMAVCAVALIAFTLGRGKPPLLVGALLLTIFAFLHIGKGPLRKAYWGAGEATVQPLGYPTLYLRWIGYSLGELPGILQPEAERKHANLDERGSLVHMLLLVQSKTPGEVAYLEGLTYSPIPELLAPRLLDPEKPRSHEGTYRLAIAYGLQTEHATLGTTIAFGLLAEAFANFGYAGVVGLAVVLGMGCGAATRWSMHAPLTSLRGLTALLALAAAIQAEYSAGVLITSLFQSAVVLLAAALVLMRVQPLDLSPARKKSLPAVP